METTAAETELPGEMPTWAEVYERMDGLFHETRGHWAGCPRLADSCKLILEPNYPYQGLQGRCLDDMKKEEGPETQAEQMARQLFEWGVVPVNEWWCEQYQANVYLTDLKLLGGRRKMHWSQNEGYPTRLRMLLNGLDPARYLDAEAELQAVATLRQHLTEREWQTYVLLGLFLETSPRSGVTYVFRKLAPTIALRPSKNGDDMRVLTTLCLHPIGYYQGTRVGVMVPTDDVLAALLMMRGDERRFWGKANHIPPRSALAGI